MVETRRAVKDKNKVTNIPILPGAETIKSKLKSFKTRPSEIKCVRLFVLLTETNWAITS